MDTEEEHQWFGNDLKSFFERFNIEAEPVDEPDFFGLRLELQGPDQNIYEFFVSIDNLIDTIKAPEANPQIYYGLRYFAENFREEQYVDWNVNTYIDNDWDLNEQKSIIYDDFLETLSAIHCKLLNVCNEMEQTGLNTPNCIDIFDKAEKDTVLFDNNKNGIAYQQIQLAMNEKAWYNTSKDTDRFNQEVLTTVQDQFSSFLSKCNKMDKKNHSKRPIIAIRNYDNIDKNKNWNLYGFTYGEFRSCMNQLSNYIVEGKITVEIENKYNRQESELIATVQKPEQEQDIYLYRCLKSGVSNQQLSDLFNLGQKVSAKQIDELTEPMGNKIADAFHIEKPWVRKSVHQDLNSKMDTIHTDNKKGNNNPDNITGRD